MNYEVNVIADSVNKYGVRAITIEAQYPRIILAELNTHRVFSRNSSSSRAIPIKTLLKQVWNNPFMPVYWGKNKPGMKAHEELEGINLWLAKQLWLLSSKVACIFAYLFSLIGLHKQIGNRIIEPWMFTRTIVTSTEWDNFFELRCHPDAQPEIKKLAEMIEDAIFNSVPEFLHEGEWHLPYVFSDEKARFDIIHLLKLSTARCARVSFLTHDNKEPHFMKDFGLHDSLVGSDPKHASPTEHQLTPGDDEKFYFNHNTWKSYRWFIETKENIK
jgi:hypothetical protein